MGCAPLKSQALRVLLVGSFVFATLAACHSLVGIGDDHFVVSPSEEAGTDAAGLDPCAHVGPGEPPDASDPGESLPPLVFAVRSANLTGRADAGTPIGFDLDGTCTCDSRTGVSRSDPSCVLPARPLVTMGCDFDGGVDNALFELNKQIERVPSASFAYSGTVDRVARCGILNLLIFLSRYNGKANDDEVEVSLIESFGIREPHAVELADERCGYFVEGGAPRAPYPARFDGTDRWSVPSKSVVRNADGGVTPLRNVGRAWVKDHRLVFDARRSDVRTVVPIVFGTQVLETGSPVFSARLVPLDAAGADIPQGSPDTPTATPAAFRLTDGYFGGRSSIDDVLSRLGALRVDQAPAPEEEAFLCSPSKALLYQTLKSVVCSAADLMTDSRDDFKSKKCDALSMVIQFEASPALVGDDYDLPAPSAGCGKGFRDSCKAN